MALRLSEGLGSVPRWWRCKQSSTGATLARLRACHGGGMRRWQTPVMIGPRSRGRALKFGRGCCPTQSLLKRVKGGGQKPATRDDAQVKTRPLGRAVWRHANTGTMRCLTFELSGRRRQGARPGLAKMYRVPPDGAWWPAVGAPLERGVRCEASIRCIGCSPGLSLRDWKSPNPQS